MIARHKENPTSPAAKIEYPFSIADISFPVFESSVEISLPFASSREIAMIPRALEQIGAKELTDCLIGRLIINPRAQMEMP